MAVEAGSAPGLTSEHRTVGRVMSVLELVIASDDGGIRLAELATALEAPKSSLHALVRGLLATGYLREEGGRYLIGPAFASLYAGLPEAVALGSRHVLAELVAKWNETVMLATWVGDSVVYVDMVESDRFIRAKPQLNRRLTLWPRSAGQVFLSQAEPKRLDGYLRRNHPDPSDAAAVQAALETARHRGYGLNIDFSPAGHIGLAVPVRSGSSPRALVLAGPRDRIEDKIDEMVSSLREAAAALG